MFELSVEYKRIDDCESDLAIFSEISKNNLIQLLCFRYVEPNKMSDIFIFVYEKYKKKKLDLFGSNFIRILSTNNRLLLLPIIYKRFRYLKCVYMKVVYVEVISAWPLNDRQMQRISEIMEKRLLKTINLINKINKSIIAGCIIRVKDTVIDGSLCGRMLRLLNLLKF